MKNSFLIILLVLTAAYCGSEAPKENPSPSWQQSESLNIRLGTRDKNGVMETYEAVFAVQLKGSDIILEAKTNVKHDEWAFVNFPDDFPPGVKDGEYEWKCTAGGKTTGSGSFTFSDSQTSLNIPKKQK